MEDYRYEQKSILTPSSDLFTELFFSYWSLINEGNILYVLWCIMDPVKIKFSQSLLVGYNFTHPYFSVIRRQLIPFI